MSDKFSSNIFDHMSPDALKGMLERDFSEGDSLDENTVIAIAEALAKRRETTADEAFSSFKENYEPSADKFSLYDIEENGLDRVRKPGRTAVNRVAAIIAVIFAVMLSVSVTADAFGVSLWESVISWTDGTFSMKYREKHNERSETDTLRELLEENKIDGGWVPKYLPNGYWQNELYEKYMGIGVRYYGKYAKGSEIICIYITKIEPYHKLLPNYHKDEGEPELYEHNGVDYYIMTDDGKYQAVWTYKKFEGCISGVESEKEIKRMIDSITAEVQK